MRVSWIQYIVYVLHFIMTIFYGYKWFDLFLTNTLWFCDLACDIIFVEMDEFEKL